MSLVEEKLKRDDPWSVTPRWMLLSSEGVCIICSSRWLRLAYTPLRIIRFGDINLKLKYISRIWKTPSETLRRDILGCAYVFTRSLRMVVLVARVENNVAFLMVERTRGEDYGKEKVD